MTTIVDLYGGPGTGKSTSAAYIFARLKQQGINAELVREYVKDWAWEGRDIGVFDQLYFLGKQARKESMLYGKVDAIVTDSPVLLSAFYANMYSPPDLASGIGAAVKSFYNLARVEGHKHIHVFLNRTKDYNPSGRFQTEDQAKDLDTKIKYLLFDMEIPYMECGTDDVSLDSLTKMVADGLRF